MQTQSGPLAARHGESLLVVEDDDGIRETLRILLEIEGYKVRAAENGRTGLDVLQRMDRPCLVLLDLMMPVMNGWEFLEAARSRQEFADLPVIVVTAFKEQAGSIKANGVITKPVDLNTLLSTVRHWCGCPGDEKE